ncbi:hypothetical protein BGZ98_008418 [Dissophora globulifera]|nr:hypothetical protein BGZ98_008418 [Dissophora globulifera]
MVAMTLILSLTIPNSGQYSRHSGLVWAVPIISHTQPLSPRDISRHSERQDSPVGGDSQAEEDPCTILGQLEEPDISWSHVWRCYESIPYNSTEANIVFSTLYTLYRDYYIFLDTATLEDQPKPFTNPPVDILKGLDLLSRRQYRGDFEFQTAVDALVSQLNDAHANYLTFCYRHYLFVQPFDLYAPVVDNQQTIRILQDNTHSDREDCEVLTIDGINALDAIQNYIDINSAISKDAGVRLNSALTANIYDRSSKQWKFNPGLFTTRAILPERQTMSYHIRCPTSEAHPQGRDEHVSFDWEVYRLISWNKFDDADSFLKQNCYKDTDPTLQKRVSSSRSKRSPSDEGGFEGVSKQSPKLQSQAGIDVSQHKTIRPLPRLEKRQSEDGQVAWLLYNGSSTAFYQLAKRPEIGVVVIPTHYVNLASEGNVMVEGFDTLYRSGVRNIILDLTSNGGGYVNFAYDLVDWMFPVDNKTSVYQSDLRASMSAKALAQADLIDDDYAGYFNPGSFSEVATKASFQKNFLLQDRLIQRAHSRLGYTPTVFMSHDLGALEMDMPWQHDAQRIVIMTDGACGSACGMSLNRLKNTHGVKSYAVGGRYGEDLSMFSFPGASVYGLDALLDDFENLGVDPPMHRIRYKGIIRVPIMEFFQEDDPVPIEYNPKLFKADFHLDYTPLTARHHELLWETVADSHWVK